MTNTIAEYVAQGDVRIIKSDAIPPAAKLKPRAQDGRIILAAGEVTGHHHAIADECVGLYEDANGNMFIRVDGTATVSHEEHGAIELLPGVYEVRVDCEYSPAEIKRVRD